MADLETAFGTFFDEIDSHLEFDIVPLYQPINGVDNKKYLGVVTVKTNHPIDAFKYRVFTGTQVQSPFLNDNQEEQKLSELRGFLIGQKAVGTHNIIEGTVEKTNNPTFTFPVPSIEEDYFVIISPISSPATQLVSRGPNTYCDGPEGMTATNLLRQTVGSASGLSVDRPLPSKQLKETFSIFYPKRILKERKRRLSSRPKKTEDNTLTN